MRITLLMTLATALSCGTGKTKLTEDVDPNRDPLPESDTADSGAADSGSSPTDDTASTTDTSTTDTASPDTGTTDSGTTVILATWLMPWPTGRTNSMSIIRRSRNSS